MRSLARRAAHGALAGTAATAGMSVVMLAASRRDRVSEPAPEVVTENVAPPVDDAPEPVEDAANTAAHFAFGTGGGALFGVLAPRLPGPAWARGPLFGVAVLLVSYEGWVPAAGILPPLHRQGPARRIELVVSHLVYGAVLGAACRSLMADGGHSSASPAR